MVYKKESKNKMRLPKGNPKPSRYIIYLVLSVCNYVCSVITFKKY